MVCRPTRTVRVRSWSGRSIFVRRPPVINYHAPSSKSETQGRVDRPWTAVFVRGGLLSLLAVCNILRKKVKTWWVSNFFLKLPLEILIFSNYQYQYIIISYLNGLIKLRTYSITIFRFQPGQLNVSTISLSCLNQLVFSIIDCLNILK